MKKILLAAAALILLAGCTQKSEMDKYIDTLK